MANQNLDYYFSHHDNPNAVVILNRGTEFEVDITSDVTQFNTTNSIDSITGSFTVTLDNNNDHLVDRFNFSRIRKMSSIEIFVKPPKDFINNAGVANSASMAIPEDVKNVEQLIDKIYGKSPSPLSEEARTKIRSQITSELNTTTVTTVPSYKMNIQGLIGANILPTAGKDGKTILFDFGKVKQDDGSYTQTSIEMTVGAPGGWTNTNTVSTESGFFIFPSGKISVANSRSVVLLTGGVVSTAKAKVDNGANLPSTLSTYAIPGFITIPNTIPSNGGDFTEANKEVAIKLPLPPGSFQRIFLGVVTNVSSQVSAGSNMTVTVSGKGVGYWLESSVVNLFPGGFEQTLTSTDLSPFANRFAQSKAMDIFRELISMGTGQFPVTTNINLSDISTTQQHLTLIARENPKSSYSDLYGNSMKTLDENGNPEEDGFVTFDDDGVDDNDVPGKIKLVDLKIKRIYLGYSVQTSIKYDGIPTSKTAPDKDWLESAKKVYELTQKNIAIQKKIDSDKQKLVVISSLAPPTTTAQKKAAQKPINEAISKFSNEIGKNDTEIAKYKAKIDKTSAGEQIAGLNVTKSNLAQKLSELTSVTGRNVFLNSFGIIDHWKKIFSTIVLEVMDDDPFLENMYPFSYAQKSPEASMDGDYISKAALAQQIAEYLQYEFYFDSNGHFILKPPFYNISVDDLGDLYKINDTDVISFSFNDTAEGIVTRIGVSGDYREAPGVEKLIMYNIFQDMRLIREYGFHQKDVSNLYYITNAADARDFGQAYLAKNNMKLFSGSITIHGRPSLRVGSPVYFLPRDTVFYIREISHEFSVGGGYQTTITVVGGRRILTGYKTALTVNNIVETVVDGEIKLVIDSDKKTAIIENYVLSNGLGADGVLYDDQVIGVPPDLTQDAANALAKKGIDSHSKTVFIVLRNKLIITNHPNQQLIGLIVDENNSMISQINNANYKYFSTLKPENIPAGALQYISPTTAQKSTIADSIREFFILYVALLDISAEKFTIQQRDAFIKTFLRVLRVTIIGTTASTKLDPNDLDLSQTLAGINGVANTSAVTAQEKNKLNLLATVFNNLVNYIDNNGLYKQLTDASGRELFTYQNYGLGYMISNEVTQINNDIFTADQLTAQAESRKNLDENLKGKATAMSSVHNANAPDFKKIIEKDFGKKYLISGSNDGKTPETKK